MNSRERVLASLSHSEPDKVPFTLTALTPGFQDKFAAKTGCSDPFDYFGADTRDVSFRPVHDLEKYRCYHEAGVETFNEWGVGLIKGSEYHFVRLIPSLNRVDSIREIEEYPLPDYQDRSCYEHLKLEVDGYHERGLAVKGFLEMTIFEVAWQIRGFEEFMSDMYFHPDWVECLLDRILEVRLFMAEKLVETGVDILGLGDDISTQRGMMMSLQHWRRFFKPRLKKIIDRARSRNPSLHIFYHSDGNPAEVIPELIDVGVDVLNPIQPECIDPKWVKREFGAYISLWGTIGTQSVLPFGTPEDVQQNVRERLDTLKEGGGILLAPTHFIEPDVPIENLFAFVETVKKYGRYARDG